MTRDYKKEAEERRQAEIDLGAKRVALYGKLEKVDKQTEKLRTAFPTLTIASVLNKPYTHVTVRARPQFMAPLQSAGVLINEFYSSNEIEFEDPLDDYPTDYLVTQLALIS